MGTHPLSLLFVCVLVVNVPMSAPSLPQCFQWHVCFHLLVTFSKSYKNLTTSPHLTPPHHTSPHLTTPHPTSPHLTSPHLTSPHLTSPHLTSPHLTSPHLTSPHLTSPHLTSPHLTSPHPTSPHLTSPHLTSPHLTSPHHSICMLTPTPPSLASHTLSQRLIDHNDADPLPSLASRNLDSSMAVK